MTRVCGLTEIGKLTARQDGKTDAYDDQSDSHREQDLPKDSLWQGKWNYEVYGDADEKWNPKNNFCNLPATFMCGINAHLHYLFDC